MKKVILVLAVVALFGCKKKDPSPQNPNPVPTTEAYCIYEDLEHNNKRFLECVSNSTSLTNKMIEYRNKGMFVSSVKKSDCADC